MQTKSPSYSVPALEKGLDILEALSSVSVPQSLADLARTLDKTASEIFRMVGCLEKRGYIMKDYSGNYSLSLKLFELAHTHSVVEKLLKAASIPMRKLANSIRESCHLSILKNGKLVVIAQEESPNQVRISVEVGARFSAITTVSGRLLLANLPDEDLAYFLQENEEYLAMNQEEKDKFITRLQDIEKKGYSYAEDETHVGVRDIAVLLGNPKVGVCAALAVCSLTAKKDSGDLVVFNEELQKYSEEITKYIGLNLG